MNHTTVALKRNGTGEMTQKQKEIPKEPKNFYYELSYHPVGTLEKLYFTPALYKRLFERKINKTKAGWNSL